MNYSDEECKLAELMYQKEEVLPIIISFSQNEDIEKILANSQEALKFLPIIDITNVEKELFVFVMPILARVMEQLYYNVIDEKENKKMPNIVQSNLQKIQTILKINKDIIAYILNFEDVIFTKISNSLIKLSDIILIIFQYCQHSQRFHQSNSKEMSDIVQLFKETQELHNKYLEFVDNGLVFNLMEENDQLKVIQLLEQSCQISQVLSGMNVKAMTDNWKSFLSLLQKSSKNLDNPNLGKAIEVLTLQIESSLQAEKNLRAINEKKSGQRIKIVGFLVKIILKLLETHRKTKINSFEEIINFNCIICSHCRFNEVNNSSCLPTLMKELVFVPYDHFIIEICDDCVFLKKLVGLDCALIKNKDGFLIFLNKILQHTSAKKNQSIFPISELISLIFKSITNSYMELMTSLSYAFYEDLVLNIAVSTLIIPNEFVKIENVLIRSVLDENIWTALLAIDSWTIILENASLEFGRITLQLLVKKLLGLKLGKLVLTSQVIHLRIFFNSLLNILPEDVVKEEILQFNENDTIWQFINMNSIPMLQRLIIQNAVDNLYTIMIQNENESSMNGILHMMEKFRVVSDIDFDNFQINLARFGPVVHRYWSFNSLTFNNFHKMFLIDLAKFTRCVANNLTLHTFLIIFNQLKQTNSPLFKLITCEMLKMISKRNFGFQENTTFIFVVSDIFIALLMDKNQIIQQTTLQIYRDFLQNQYWEAVINIVQKIPTVKKHIDDYLQPNVNNFTISFNYLMDLTNAKFQHECIRWLIVEEEEEVSRNVEPEIKKIKYSDDTDELVDDFKNNCARLIKCRTSLNNQQLAELRKVLNKLSNLLQI